MQFFFIYFAMYNLYAIIFILHSTCTFSTNIKILFIYPLITS